MTEITPKPKDETVAPVHSPGSIAPFAKGAPPALNGAVPDAKGSVSLPAGAKPVPTDTIPAVEGTTLTQVPESLHLRGPVAQAVPFGRQMNSAAGYPTDIIHDPQVFPRAEVPVAPAGAPRDFQGQPALTTAQTKS